MPFLLFLVLFAVILAARSIRVVAQGEEQIVERLGRYHTTLKPGLNFLMPFLDKVSYRVPTKDLILDIAQQEVITRDNAVVIVNAVAFVKVTDPKLAVYGVSNFERAISNLVQTALRSIIGTMELDHALSSREDIKARLKASISPEAQAWGMTLVTVELQDIRPSPSMQVAMEQQAAAERSRKAMVTAASGKKDAAILEAEGRMESAKRDAEAQILLSESTARALRNITESMPDRDLPALYLLGERYIKSMETLAGSANGKVVVLPADLQQTLQGLLGTLKK